jgi:hypothetical protein
VTARAGHTARANRALRGGLLAVCSAALAIAAHAMAGGGVADTALTVPIAVLLAWGGAALADRRHELLALLGVLAVTQAVIHLMLTTTAHRHTDQHAPPPAVDGTVMLVAHATATILTAVLLTRVSSALAVVSSAVERLLGSLRAPRGAPVPVAAGTTPARSVAAGPGRLLEVLLRRSCARRGPPPSS